jgi:hypothetical protein
MNTGGSYVIRMMRNMTIHTTITVMMAAITIHVVLPLFKLCTLSRPRSVCIRVRLPWSLSSAPSITALSCASASVKCIEFIFSCLAISASWADSSSCVFNDVERKREVELSPEGCFSDGGCSSSKADDDEGMESLAGRTVTVGSAGPNSKSSVI